MKKFAMLLLCVALVLSCTVMAFADPSQYIITVNPAFSGETYNAYKIFDVTYTTPSGADSPVYTYTTSESNEWFSVVTTPADATNTSSYSGDPTTDNVFTVDGLTFTKTSQLDANNHPIYIVTLTNGDNLTDTQKQNIAKAIANKLYANVANKTAANAQPVVASGTSASIDVGSDGYYFVTTSLGSLCALNTASPTVTVADKNAVPTVQKKVDGSSDHVSGTTYVDRTSASIGQAVDFKIVVTDADNTGKQLTLTDTMPVGSTLTYVSGHQGNFRISVQRDEANGGGTTALTLNYDSATGVYTYDMDNDNTADITVTPNANGRDFVIVFSETFMSDLDDQDQIIILYTGELTSNAYIYMNSLGENGGQAYNDNTVVMTYSAVTDQDTARVLTYQAEFVKVDDDDNKLTGAKFALYDAETGGHRINVSLLSSDSTTGTNTYRIDPDTQNPADIEAGVACLKGLGAGTYYLEETEAPENYNALTSRVPIQIVNTNLSVELTQDHSKWESGLKVVNHSGSVLPSTGGIGTYLFYGIGAILVVGAVVVLVSKKRMHAYSD